MKSRWFIAFVIFAVVAAASAMLYSFWPTDIYFPFGFGRSSHSIKPLIAQYSLNGTVKNISSDKYTLTLADGKTDKDFSIPADVVVVKRSAEGLVASHLSEVKLGSEVVFYTKSDPAKTMPFVFKIELIK